MARETYTPVYSAGRVLTDEHGRTYEIVQFVGHGGFAEVYQARRGERTLALKILLPGQSTEAKGRFRDEARLHCSLSHHSVPYAEGTVTLDGEPALVMAYVDGQNLSQCLRGPDAMPVPALLDVIGQVCDTLDALGVVHRDIKPSNIRISRSGGVAILDFGLALHEDVPRDILTKKSLYLSYPYVAPERLLGKRYIPTTATDLFALGCILFRRVTGALLIPDEQAEAYRLHTMPEADWEEHVRTRMAHPQMRAQPDGVQQLVRDLLHRDPTRRPTARDAADRCHALHRSYPAALGLRAWCRGERPPPEPAPRPAPRPTPRPVEPRPATWWVPAIAAVGAMSAVAVGILSTMLAVQWAATRQREEAPPAQIEGALGPSAQPSGGAAAVPVPAPPVPPPPIRKGGGGITEPDVRPDPVPAPRESPRKSTVTLKWKGTPGVKVLVSGGTRDKRRVSLSRESPVVDVLPGEYGVTVFADAAQPERGTGVDPLVVKDAVDYVLTCDPGPPIQCLQTESQR